MCSDTCGSIRIPAANNNLFGLRVTQGFSSRDGIIPLSHTQDVGGPLASSMIDLALVLDATVGFDPNDPQTAVAKGQGPESFAALADENALEGLRLGLLQSHLLEKAPFEEITTVVKSAVSKMTERGAEAVELQISGLEELLGDFAVVRMEIVADLQAYLEASGAPVKSVTEILDSGLYHAKLEERYRIAIKIGANLEDYPDRLAERDTLARAITEAMDEHNIDVLVYPTLRVKPKRIEEGQWGSSCQLSAQSGFPALTMPAGLTPDGVPVGLELLAKPFEDDRLVSIGFAYEKIATPHRTPTRAPSLLSDVLTIDFAIQSTTVRGKARLDRPTQSLHYNLEFAGIDAANIRAIALHRGAEYTNGPVIDLLGTGQSGSVAVRNADLDDLLDDGLYVAVYVHNKREEAGRGQIVSQLP